MVPPEYRPDSGRCSFPQWSVLAKAFPLLPADAHRQSRRILTTRRSFASRRGTCFLATPKHITRAIIRFQVLPISYLGPFWPFAVRRRTPYFADAKPAAIHDASMTKSSAPKHTDNAGIGKESGAQPAPEDQYQISDAQAFGRNMAKVADRSQRLITEFFRRQAEHFGREPVDPLNIGSAWFALLKQM